MIKILPLFSARFAAVGFTSCVLLASSFVSWQARAEAVPTDIPQTYSVVCSPTDAPVTITIVQPVHDLYDCTLGIQHGEKTATYTPKLKNIDVEFGASHYDGTPQTWSEPARHCRASLEFLVIAIRNDHIVYSSSYYKNGDAAVYRYSTPVCSSGPQH